MYGKIINWNRAFQNFEDFTDGKVVAPQIVAGITICQEQEGQDRFVSCSRLLPLHWTLEFSSLGMLHPSFVEYLDLQSCIGLIRSRRLWTCSQIQLQELARTSIAKRSLTYKQARLVGGGWIFNYSRTEVIWMQPWTQSAQWSWIGIRHTFIATRPSWWCLRNRSWSWIGIGHTFIATSPSWWCRLNRS